MPLPMCLHWDCGASPSSWSRFQDKKFVHTREQINRVDADGQRERGPILQGTSPNGMYEPQFDDVYGIYSLS